MERAQKPINEVEKIPEGAQERYQLFTHQIEHETDTQNQKIIYHVISQSFFFGAYSSLMNAPKEAKNPLYSMQQDVLLWALPIAAVCIAFLTYASIVASLLHVKELTHNYNDQFRGTPDSLPEIAGNGFLRGLGRLSTYGLPAVIILAWIVILGVQVSQTINGSAAPL